MTTQNSSETIAPAQVLADNSKPERKMWWWLVLALAVVLAAFYLFKIPHAKLNEKPMSLGHADVWVHSQNFALLPHDLLQVPLLKSLLTEDFLYFYAQDEDWLSLQGAMRRISFEHDLNWADTLLQKVAGAPADVYMWHDDSHALAYWALSIERDQLLVVAQKLASLKLVADKQLHEIARIKIDGDEVPVLSITLSDHRNMVLAAHDKRLVLLSALRMVSGEDGAISTQGEQLIQNLLSKQPVQRAQVVAEWQAVDKAQFKQDAQQTIFLSNRFFAQGYGAFMPSTRAIRFDYDGQHWLTHAQLSPANFDARIWTYMPANAAFCASSPIDWAQVQKAADGAQGLSAKINFESEFESSAAICWYAENGDEITQPLVAVLRKPKQPSNDALKALFDWGVATNQDYLKQLVALYRQRQQIKDRLFLTKQELVQLYKTVISKDLKQDKREAKKLALEQQEKATQQAIVSIEKELDALNPKIVQAKRDTIAPAKIAHENIMVQDGTFSVLARKLAIDAQLNSSPQLALNPEVVYFTSNQALMKTALAVGGKRYPNLQESSQLLDAKAQQFLYVNPSQLAKLINATGHEALSLESKENLRAAFDYHMPQRLDALSKHAPFSLVVDSAKNKSQQWQPLLWQSAP